MCVLPIAHLKTPIFHTWYEQNAYCAPIEPDPDLQSFASTLNLSVGKTE